MSKTLKEYEELFDEYNFFKIHLSHLINLDFIHSIHKHDGMKVEMKDGTVLPLSRSRKRDFLARI